MTNKAELANEAILAGIETLKEKFNAHGIAMEFKLLRKPNDYHPVWGHMTTTQMRPSNVPLTPLIWDIRATPETAGDTLRNFFATTFSGSPESAQARVKIETVNSSTVTDYAANVNLSSEKETEAFIALASGWTMLNFAR